MLREDSDAPGDVSVNQPPAVGAVLTSQRLLVVSPQLRVLVAGPPAPGITSCLWLGPAPLYATSDNQVQDWLSLASFSCFPARRCSVTLFGVCCWLAKPLP